MTLAQDNLEAFAVCYQKAVDRLSKVDTFLPCMRAELLIPSPIPDCARTGLSCRLRLLQGTDTMASSQTSTFVTILPSFR